jgi:exodeoxyribonuclease VII large subunit
VTGSLFDPPSEGHLPPALPPSRPTALSITELVSQLRRSVEQATGQVWVKGEVTSVRVHGSGHWYFSLKDEQSSIRCTMWKTYNVKAGTPPPEGAEVYVLGAPTIFEKRGELSFAVVVLLSTAYIGQAQLAKERVRSALDKDGLFDPSRKRPFPRFPRRIAVVTSLDGAALHDIITVTRRRWRSVRLYLVPAQVQGPDAPRALVRALAVVDQLTRVEVCVIGRGGGSKEDLAAFDNERVCRAVAALRVPCMSAVGHETDVSLTDLVADAYAPTPSAAMERVLPDLDDTMRHAESLASRLAHGLRRRTAIVSARLTRSGDRLQVAMGRRLEAPRSLLDQYAGQLEALSPLKVLGRGYSVARLADGRVARRRTDLPSGTAFNLSMTDGEIAAHAD